MKNNKEYMKKYREEHKEAWDENKMKEKTLRLETEYDKHNWKIVITKSKGVKL